ATDAGEDSTSAPDGSSADASPGDSASPLPHDAADVARPADATRAVDAASGDGSQAEAGLLGPLSASRNPNYFQDSTGRPLVLAGSHTWNDLQDWGGAGTPVPFDFEAYANFLAAHGHNFTLLWRTELPKFCGLPTTDTSPPDFTTSPQPWLRTGPGMA